MVQRDERAERLKAQLRANLRRRKAPGMAETEGKSPTTAEQTSEPATPD